MAFENEDTTEEQYVKEEEEFVVRLSWKSISDENTIRKVSLYPAAVSVNSYALVFRDNKWDLVKVIKDLDDATC
jgi:hypothetical protein